MGIQYHCANRKRQQILRDSGLPLNGIDYLEVLDNDAPPGTARQRTLLVRMLKPSPWGLSADNVRLDGGVRVQGIQVEWVLRASEASDGGLVTSGMITPQEQAFFEGLPDPDQVWVVRTNADGDYAPYTLRLVLSPTSDAPPAGWDPILSQVSFSFKVECPSEFDCQSKEICPPALAEEPLIDYMAKDYASLRRLMLDRLSVILPDWQERSPADIGMALVEVMAYAGDYLSYYQDAVATEAYLGTARRRTSVRRHARLLDYAMHDGCNARAWVQVAVDHDLTLEKGTPLLSHVVGQHMCIRPDSPEWRQALAQGPVVFQTLHEAALFAGHNTLTFYTWGDEACCLPAGATRATLQGHFPHLKPGDVLILMEQRGPDTGQEADADLAHRHAVRLTEVTLAEDPLGGQILDPGNTEPVPVTEIAWHAQDALPFPLCLKQVKGSEAAAQAEPASVALGNVLLADHGRTTPQDPLPFPIDHPRLRERNITWRVPYNHGAARQQAATATLRQDPRQALPAVKLTSDGATWLPRRDLLASGRFATEFVVETEGDGGANLRFGDGIYGQPPPSAQETIAHYRVGNGAAGNIGADALGHAVTNVAGVVGLRNPLPAQGGTDPETLDEVRLYAPQALRTQERAITPDDYAQVAQRHPEVQKAVASRRWTGSWHTMFLTVDRKGGLRVDASFELELRRFLERFRLAGQDLEIDGPRFVALEMAFAVCVQPGYYRSEVKAALLDVFSNRDLPDGRRGFFHPDKFTFGQPVYLSKIAAAAMQVPGVRWINTSDRPPNLFKRRDELPHDEFQKGRIDMGRLEIARLDNDPSQPENGKLDFIMEGGI